MLLDKKKDIQNVISCAKHIRLSENDEHVLLLLLLFWTGLYPVLLLAV